MQLIQHEHGMMSFIQGRLLARRMASEVQRCKVLLSKLVTYRLRLHKCEPSTPWTSIALQLYYRLTGEDSVVNHLGVYFNRRPPGPKGLVNCPSSTGSLCGVSLFERHTQYNLFKEK